MMRQRSKVLLLLCVFVFASAVIVPFVMADESVAGADPYDWCGTHKRWLAKQGKSVQDPSACPEDGPCDSPVNRDAAIPGPLDPIAYIQMVVHILRNDDGSNPISDGALTQAQIDNLNADYLPSRIQFEVTVNYINSTQWRFLSESEIDPMKNATAIQPDKYLNVWATTVDFGYSFGTFPWSSDALAPTGGIVMGHFHWQGGANSVFAHEVGHCLGLYHIFNGIDEVQQCGACYEAIGASNRDVLGDRCSDTEPAPTNASCGTTPGTEPCSGQPWGNTQNAASSFMSYTNGCYAKFTEQQKGRMLCWSEDVLDGWITGVRIDADTIIGPAPFDVQFSGLTSKSVTLWDWDFGDGDSANVQTPTHTYDNPGIYTVRVDIEAVDGVYAAEIQDYVAVFADTMYAISVSGQGGQEVEVVVYARNYVPLQNLKVPFSWSGNMNLTFSNFSVEGLRSENLNSGLILYDPFNKRATYNFSNTIDQRLEPGSGPILKLYFILPEGATDDTAFVSVANNGTHPPSFNAVQGVYEPFIGAPALIDRLGGCCIGLRGNVDGDIADDVNIADLLYLVEYTFANPPGPAPNCTEEADADGSTVVDIADVLYLVEYSFANPPGPAPVACP